MLRKAEVDAHRKVAMQVCDQDALVHQAYLVALMNCGLYHDILVLYQLICDVSSGVIV